MLKGKNMGISSIILIGVSLAMDAFAVAVCKGLSMKKTDLEKAVIVALYFGFFQALMPSVGYFLGSTFSSLVVQIDHWIAFALLVSIGINMIKESFEENEKFDDDVKFKKMVVLAIATSIDAFAVGITFAFLDVNLIFAVSVIGLITFALSFIGVVIGNKFGSKYENKAEFVRRFCFKFTRIKNFIRAFRNTDIIDTDECIMSV